MIRSLPAAPRINDSGFGIVEVIVSMFLLSLMAMAFLPVLVQALQVSRVNASIATATQLLSADLDRARHSAASCASGDVNINEGPFTVIGVWGPCVGDFPLALSYSSTVKNAETNKVLADAVTLILVTE
ncbi:prepilin-type N-terminal cleavage/methylation domain-containing protein [Cryobacterium sp. Y11]|jgi:type II secretory pathway pseudopilin PulG|uniref:prepilin-type N-terminal cleavage/methylation domain-containing protein n=1 Tax=Cryobacterium sp. Y11 TaxID=2045016 RepID=UPI000CE43ACB|nr:prepilin-type N-terminal cleavage/methylation domain-containing protein [Cryobacterium sp. Y11]